MQNTKDYFNNYLRISGRALTEPTYTHTVKAKTGDVKYYEFKLESKRLSNHYDIINVSIREDLFETIDFAQVVEVIGEVRTANIETTDNNRSKLKIYAFATLLNNSTNDAINEFEAITYLCRKPIYRRTPMGRIITDLALACIRSYKTRSDYFPVICWGDEAERASELEIGDKIYIKGRFQSRPYIKKINDTEINKIAYEISLKSFERME